MRHPSAGPDLGSEEQEHVRVALRFLRVRCGDWASVAKALAFKRSTVMNASYKDPVSASMAFRVARLLCVSLDDLLAGKFVSPTCPHCKQVMPEEL